MFSTAEVLQQCNEIFKDVLDDKKINLTPETTADDVEDWDSLTHVELMAAIEDHFKILFTTTEITSFKNAGQLAECIMKKTSS